MKQKKRYDWIKIKNYYIHHEISLEDLAVKFKASYSAVRKHCCNEKWVEIKKEKSIEIEQEVAEKTKKSVIDKKLAVNQYHNELYEQGLQVAKMLLDEYLAELKENKKGKRKATAYNLDFVMKAIANAQKGQRTALNLDNKSEETKTDSAPQVMIIKGLDETKI